LSNPPKKWKTNAIFLVVIWVVLLVASVTVLSSVVTPFLRSLQTQNLISPDWAGYAVSSNTLFEQPLVMAVSGSWIVPAVAVSETDTYSAAWIGVGGQNDETLIQVGSEHDSIRGEATYSLWYELLPNYSIPIPEITVTSGDLITASVTLTDSQTNNWTIRITDETVGQTFQQTFLYNSTQLTAEWVLERPTVNNRMATLADFGSITFMDAKAQIADKVGTIGDFPNYEIAMQNRQNTNLVSISDLSDDGSSFTITYEK
jgi:hypothetical protein